MIWPRQTILSLLSEVLWACICIRPGSLYALTFVVTGVCKYCPASHCADLLSDIPEYFVHYGNNCFRSATGCQQCLRLVASAVLCNQSTGSTCLLCPTCSVLCHLPRVLTLHVAKAVSHHSTRWSLASATCIHSAAAASLVFCAFHCRVTSNLLPTHMLLGLLNSLRTALLNHMQLNLMTAIHLFQGQRCSH